MTDESLRALERLLSENHTLIRSDVQVIKDNVAALQSEIDKLRQDLHAIELKLAGIGDVTDMDTRVRELENDFNRAKGGALALGLIWGIVVALPGILAILS